MPDPCCSLINTLYIGIIRQKLDFASKSFHKYPLKKNRYAAQRGNGNPIVWNLRKGAVKMRAVENSIWDLIFGIHTDWVNFRTNTVRELPPIKMDSF